MSYKEEILKRIDSFDDDYIFIVNDFLDISGFETVRSVLNRLVKDNEIERVMKGFYSKPLYYSPRAEKVAQAIARKYNLTVAPAEEAALYELGLADKVPSEHVFITDGRYAKFNYGNITIEFKHRAHKDIFNKSRLTAIVIESLKTIGKENITDEHIKHLKQRITPKLKLQLFEESRTTSEWIYEIIRKICK